MNTKIALQYLERDQLLHADMLFAIKEGTAQLLYAGRDGVALRSGDINMVSLASQEVAESVLEMLGQASYVCTHQDWLTQLWQSVNPNIRVQPCFQAVYNKPSAVVAGILSIRQLLPDDFAAVTKKHSEPHRFDYIGSRIASGQMYGGFDGDVLCGIIGFHQEGAIGLLEVFDQYRGRGYGSELLLAMTKKRLDEGKLAYSQIKIQNQASLAMHKKLAFDLSQGTVTWCVRQKPSP